MDVMPTRFVKAGDAVFSEGDTPDEGLYYICYGKVEVSRVEPDGTRTLAELDEGAVFGEMALINAQPRNATVTATEDSGFYNISRDTFQHQVSQLDSPMRGVFQVFVLTIRDFLAQRDEWIAEKEEIKKSVVSSGSQGSDGSDNESDSAPSGLMGGQGVKLSF